MVALAAALRAPATPAPIEPGIDVIRHYAPLIYLHPEEAFMPSSLEDFAPHVQVECDFKLVTTDIFALTDAMLPPGLGGAPPGSDTARCRMTTREPMFGPYDIKAFFHGRVPAADRPVPVYVFTYDVKGVDTFTAQYSTFYPYNQGKLACPALAPGDRCLGKRAELGDHVADWELVSIRFSGGKPVAVHVGAHGNREPNMASTYRLSAAGWGGLAWEDDHPIVYSAAGSHGTWATAGTHNYKTLPTGERLNDHTAKGARWETWRAVVLADGKYDFLLNRYAGDWGNAHMGRDPCDLSMLGIHGLCRMMGIPVGSEYQLNDGPSMPGRARDRRYLKP
jgi:hypothetical protein